MRVKRMVQRGAERRESFRKTWKANRMDFVPDRVTENIMGESHSVWLAIYWSVGSSTWFRLSNLWSKGEETCHDWCLDIYYDLKPGIWVPWEISTRNRWTANSVWGFGSSHWKSFPKHFGKWLGTFWLQTKGKE